MFREKSSEALNSTGLSSFNNEKNTTVLREDASFEGKLVFEGNVLVNGRIKGEIYSSGDLTIGNGGRVEGTVEIGTIHIFGEVHGNIKAKQKIVINAPALVRGDITAPSLVIEEGAVFEGNCSMGEVSAERLKERKNQGNDKVIDLHSTGTLV